VLSDDDGRALAILALGAEGLFSAAANEVPDRMKSFVSAVLGGRMEQARELHDAHLPLMRVKTRSR